jgi:hypothetical protein
MWWNTLSAPPGNLTVNIGGVDPVNHIWLENYKETMQWVAFDMLTGDKLWGPSISQTETEPFDYYGTAGMEDRIAMIANDKVYSMQFSGVLFVFDEFTGDLLWTYGNSNEDGNSTRAGYQNAYGLYPTLIMAMNNDVLYTAATEHTVNTPIYKGARVIAINATDGSEIWDMSSFVNSFHSISMAIADGYTTWWNGYSNQIFTTGRGPSETTVTASPKVSIWGDQVLVEGTVMDIATGATQDEQSARFPNGLPAVSDASMTDWMEYVYCQRPLPTNTVGVEVILETLDPNFNYYEIGRATTDQSGSFSLMFEPLVPGKYTIFARFAGTDGYWPSYAETAIGVVEAGGATPIEPEPPTEQPTEPEPEAPFITTEVAIIIAVAVIAVVAVAAYWVLRRRK